MNFSHIADEFIAKVQAAKLAANTEVNVIYHCVDDLGKPIAPFRESMVGTVQVKGGPPGFAQNLAAGLHADTIIGNINYLIRPATPERFCVPRHAPKIPMRLVRMELEIIDG
jgi:hypothetical protein